MKFKFDVTAKLRVLPLSISELSKILATIPPSFLQIIEDSLLAVLNDL
jgi:hypothetical protein